MLAADMKRYYSLEKPITDVSGIKEGKAFAVERLDGTWCRYVGLSMEYACAQPNENFASFGSSAERC